MTLSNEQVFEIWQRPVPGAQGSAPEDIPTLQVFLPEKGNATGASVVVCPGGGYVVLADHEGVPVAQWLAAHGVTAFVLRYRLGFKYQYPTQFNDGRRAIRYVRAHAQQWQLDPTRIGMLGFSAGGHLTSMVATHLSEGDTTSKDYVERVSSRPDVQILIYPVISEVDGGWHIWSNILGEHPPADILALFPSEKHISSLTPPAFLVHSTDDVGVPVVHSDRYAAALATAGIPYEYVRGQLGDHGFGLQENWTTRCIDWLHTQGFAR